MICKSFDKDVPCTEAATVTVFWPGKETVACGRHHLGMQRLASVMGFTLSVRPIEPEAPTAACSCGGAFCRQGLASGTCGTIWGPLTCSNCGAIMADGGGA